MANPAYKRVLLKLSGEALMGEKAFGVDPEVCHKIASQVKELCGLGVQVSIVVGGGNIFRGAHADQLCMERSPADHIGMLATIINGISLQQAFERIDCESRIMSAISCDVMAENYSWKNAIDYLQRGLVLIFVGGTGNPYFTTDSAAALRALETKAEVFFKATKVDGVYDKDPVQFPDAKKFETISYAKILASNLKVMDSTAVALARDNRIPIRVFNLLENSLVKAVCNKSIGTLVEGS